MVAALLKVEAPKYPAKPDTDDCDRWQGTLKPRDGGLDQVIQLSAIWPRLVLVNRLSSAFKMPSFLK